MKKLVLVERQDIGCRHPDQESRPMFVELECDDAGNVINCKENDELIKSVYPQDYGDANDNGQKECA